LDAKSVGQPDGTDNTAYYIMDFVPPISQDPTADTVLGIGIDNTTRQSTPSLNQYAYDTINSYRSAANVTDFKVIKAGTNITMGGHPGYILYYTKKVQSNPAPRTYLEAGTVVDGNILYLDWLCNVRETIHRYHHSSCNADYQFIQNTPSNRSPIRTTTNRDITARNTTTADSRNNTLTGIQARTFNFSLLFRVKISIIGIMCCLGKKRAGAHNISCDLYIRSFRDIIFIWADSLKK
jgi:hypothetical protein